MLNESTANMIYLIEYNRAKGALVRITEFAVADRTRAEDERLKLELDLNRRGVRHEVVILEADNEAALRVTHRRYFESIGDLASGGAG